MCCVVLPAQATSIVVATLGAYDKSAGSTRPNLDPTAAAGDVTVLQVWASERC